MGIFFMSLEEVLDKSKIDFPKGLNLEQIEDLLKYLAEKLRADIIYNPSYHKSITPVEGRVKISDGSFNISGTISLGGRFDSFTMDSNCVSEGIYKVRKLEFNRTPGWKIDNYREEIRKLWDDVREAVRGYFELR